MLYESLANQVNYQDYFDEAWKYAHPLLDTSRYQIDENFHFVFLMVHTAKHISTRAVACAPSWTWCFSSRAQGRNMNWVWITQQLEKLELLTFTQTCFSLCEKWFGVTMPISSCPLDETFYLSATRKVFEDGIFAISTNKMLLHLWSNRSTGPRDPAFWFCWETPGRRFFPHTGHAADSLVLLCGWETVSDARCLDLSVLLLPVPQAQGCGGESDESLCPAGRDDSPGRVHYKLGTVDWHCKMPLSLPDRGH